MLFTYLRLFFRKMKGRGNNKINSILQAVKDEPHPLEAVLLSLFDVEPSSGELGMEGWGSLSISLES